MRHVLDAADALPAWRALPAPAPGLRCVVVVPARDEAPRLAVALDALAHQVPAGGVAPPLSEVLLLANNCTDATTAVARAFAASRPGLALHVVEATFAPGQANVGRARRELMDEAARRLVRGGSTPREAFIASTDADTRVAPDWLARTVIALDAGADAVGGRIVTADADADVPLGAALRRASRLDLAHALARCRIADLVDPDPADPWPNHHQHFGASLAVRVEAYVAVGGVPAVAFLEDEALVRALEAADRPVRRSPLVRVTTSARRDGRAEVGLSWQLRQWEAGAIGEPRHESAADLVAGLHARRALRALWFAARPADPAAVRALHALHALGNGVGLGPDDVAAALDACAVAGASIAFGALWQRLDRRRLERLAERGRLLPCAESLAQLRAWLAQAPSRAAASGATDGDVAASTRPSTSSR